jgi:hypothetical protein
MLEGVGDGFELAVDASAPCDLIADLLEVGRDVVAGVVIWSVVARHFFVVQPPDLFEGRVDDGDHVYDGVFQDGDGLGVADSVTSEEVAGQVDGQLASYWLGGVQIAHDCHVELGLVRRVDLIREEKKIGLRLKKLRKNTIC